MRPTITAGRKGVNDSCALLARETVPVVASECLAERVDGLLHRSRRRIKIQARRDSCGLRREVPLEDVAEVVFASRRSAVSQLLQALAVELEKQWVRELGRKQRYLWLIKTEGVEEPLGRLQLASLESSMLDLGDTGKAA